jgi:hypothetical protein
MHRYLILLLLVACGGADSAGSGSKATVRDSAGIEIVENAGPAWAQGAGWTVVDSPVVDIGGVAGDAAYDLTQITGVIRLSDGRLAVAVAGSYQVRFYDAEGTHLRSAGTQGSGPGEFQGIAGFYPSPGDSVLVMDMMVRRLTVLDGSGNVGRTFSLGGETGFAMPGEGGRMSMSIPAGVFTDGSILGVLMPFRVNDERKGTYRDSMTYIRYGADGAARDTLGKQPGIEMEQVAMSFGQQRFSAPSPVPLGRNTVAAVDSGRILVAQNDRWQVEIYDQAGTLTRIVRVNQAPRPITPEEVAAHRAWLIEQMQNQPMIRGMPEQIKKQFTDRIEQASYPAQFPFIEAILPGGDGSIWVQEQTDPEKPRRFAVLDGTGQLLGTVQMPERFRPTHIRGDLLAGVWQDQDDVEHARVYRLRKALSR